MAKILKPYTVPAHCVSALSPTSGETVYLKPGKDYQVVSRHGDRLELKVGRFWLEVPANLFDMEATDA